MVRGERGQLAVHEPSEAGAVESGGDRHSSDLRAAGGSSVILPQEPPTGSLGSRDGTASSGPWPVAPGPAGRGGGASPRVERWQNRRAPPRCDHRPVVCAESGEVMAEVLLFHHALGLTTGIMPSPTISGGRAPPFTRPSLRRTTFGTSGGWKPRRDRLCSVIERGVGRGSTAADVVYGGLARRAARPNSPRRGPGRGALLFYSCVPASDSGPGGGLPVRSTAWMRTRSHGRGRCRRGSGARRVDRPNRAVPLPGQPALLRRRHPAVVRRGRGGAPGAGVGVPPGPPTAQSGRARRRSGRLSAGRLSAAGG
jgi:hypothetical protein